MNPLTASRRVADALRTAGTRDAIYSLCTIKEYSSSSTRSLDSVVSSVSAPKVSIPTDASGGKAQWDYDILINGGGIVGVTFAAQILQKTSNRLKIGLFPAAALMIEIADVVAAVSKCSIEVDISSIHLTFEVLAAVMFEYVRQLLLLNCDHS